MATRRIRKKPVKEATATEVYHVWRDAGTGRFVSMLYAILHKATTIRHTYFKTRSE